MMLVVGTVIQTFMLEYGISAENVALFTSVMQIAQVISIICTSAFADKFKNIIKITAWVQYLPVLLSAVLLFFSIKTGMAPDVTFRIIFAVSIIANVFIGLDSVFGYKLPYHIFDIADYGTVTNISGVLNGILGASFSSILVYFTARYSYFNTMRAFFFAGIVFFTGAFAAALSYKQIPFEHNETKKEKTNLLNYKPFTVLIIPNLLRGLCYGIATVPTVIGYHYGILDASTASIIVLLTQISGITGCFIYSQISRRSSGKDGLVLLLSSIGTAIFMPMMLVGKSSAIFLAFYFLLSFAINFVNYGVPIIVVNIVDYEYAGQYSAWRMMLHTLGTAIGSGVVIKMFNAIGGLSTLIIAGACQLISGIVYYIYLKKLSKSKIC